MFVFNKEKEYEQVSLGVKRKILSYCDDIMAVEVAFVKGAVGAPHSHPHRQISYVLSGKFAANIGGVEQMIEKGDTYVTKENEEHGVVCIEDGVLLDIFTPMRKDFIK